MRDTYEIQILRKNQTAVTVFFMGALSMYYGNVATVGFVRDITFRKKLQQSLVFSQKLAAIGKLSAELAHEINNPLTSVLTFNKLIEKILQRQPFPIERLPEIRDYTQFITNEVSRCTDIAKNLLDFARFAEIRTEEVDIHHVLNKAIAIIAHRAQLSNITIITSYSPDVPPVEGDFNRLEQAFLNVFANAVEAMPDGGVLGIVTSFKPQDYCLYICKAEKNTIQVTISDTGVGIPAENLDSIFEPFFSTKEEASGVGLGLSVAYGIITQHNGRIVVHSEPDNGSCFLVEFPTVLCGSCLLLER